MMTSKSPTNQVPVAKYSHSNPELSANLAEMAKHPEFRERLRLLQAEARGLVGAVIEDMSKALMAAESPLSGTQTAIAGTTLARTSRRADMNVKLRREYVTRFLRAALRNRRNADWDPDDPSTDRADPEDAILPLLRLDLKG